MTDDTATTETFPDADDGFHEPAEETKRRNRTTALIILAALSLWVLYGLRKPLFGWLFG